MMCCAALRCSVFVAVEPAGKGAFGKRRRGKNGKVGPPVHDDLVGRRFAADAPNRLWLADITEHRTGEGKLYLSAIKDAFSKRIVGYSIDSRMKSRLATQALASAVARRGDVADCILHTDRGSQFRSRRFVHALGRCDMVESMGRVGAAGDNAAMESFFGLLQKNALSRRRYDTREQLRIAIVTWIKRTYHRRRRQIRSRPVDPDRIRSNRDHTGQPGRVKKLSPIRTADPGSSSIASDVTQRNRPDSKTNCIRTKCVPFTSTSTLATTRKLEHDP